MPAMSYIPVVMVTMEMKTHNDISWWHKDSNDSDENSMVQWRHVHTAIMKHEWYYNDDSMMSNDDITNLTDMMNMFCILKWYDTSDMKHDDNDII